MLMQNNDFDNIFSHKFSQLPGEPYSGENWSELSRRMDMHDRRRKGWLLSALFFLLGLLAGGNVYWWYQWREATRQWGAPHKETTLFQSDTIVHSTVVYRYDTIYQNIAPMGRAGLASAAPSSGNAPSGSFSAQNSSAAGNNAARVHPLAPQPTLIEPPAIDSVKQQLANGDAATPPLHTIVRQTPGDTVERAMPPRSVEATTADTIENELLIPSPLPAKKSRSPFLYFARPRLGISATWGVPSLPHKSSGAVFGAGIRGDVEIARNFRLGAEIAYLQASLKSTDTQALEAIDIDIPNPGGDFHLKYWETNFLPAFTYALHLRYEIPLRGNWKPWLGVGGQAMTRLPFEVEYEFKNDVNSFELHVPAKAGSSTKVQGILFMLGAECRLNPHFYFGVEGYMLRNFGEYEDDHEEGQGLLDKQIGLKTSLFYKF